MKLGLRHSVLLLILSLSARAEPPQAWSSPFELMIFDQFVRETPVYNYDVFASRIRIRTTNYAGENMDEWYNKIPEDALPKLLEKYPELAQRIVAGRAYRKAHFDAAVRRADEILREAYPDNPVDEIRQSYLKELGNYRRLKANMDPLLAEAMAYESIRSRGYPLGSSPSQWDQQDSRDYYNLIEALKSQEALGRAQDRFLPEPLFLEWKAKVQKFTKALKERWPSSGYYDPGFIWELRNYAVAVGDTRLRSTEEADKWVKGAKAKEQEAFLKGLNERVIRTAADLESTKQKVLGDENYVGGQYSTLREPYYEWIYDLLWWKKSQGTEKLTGPVRMPSLWNLTNHRDRENRSIGVARNYYESILPGLYQPGPADVTAFGRESTWPQSQFEVDLNNPGNTFSSIPSELYFGSASDFDPNTVKPYAPKERNANHFITPNFHIQPINGVLAIPRPAGHDVSVNVYINGHILDSNKVKLWESPDGNVYAQINSETPDALIEYRAFYTPRSSRTGPQFATEGSIPPLTENELKLLYGETLELERIGATPLAKSLADLVVNAGNTGQPVRVSDLERVIRETSHYSYVPVKEGPLGGSTYESLKPFLDPNGNFCFQSAGAASLLERLLKKILVEHPEFAIRRTNVLVRNLATNKILASDYIHRVELVHRRDGVRYQMEVSPEGWDLRNPADAPPNTEAGWTEWLRKNKPYAIAGPGDLPRPKSDAEPPPRPVSRERPGTHSRSAKQTEETPYHLTPETPAVESHMSRLSWTGTLKKAVLAAGVVAAVVAGYTNRESLPDLGLGRLVAPYVSMRGAQDPGGSGITEKGEATPMYEVTPRPGSGLTLADLPEEFHTGNLSDYNERTVRPYQEPSLDSTTFGFRHLATVVPEDGLIAIERPERHDSLIQLKRNGLLVPRTDYDVVETPDGYLFARVKNGRNDRYEIEVFHAPRDQASRLDFDSEMELPTLTDREIGVLKGEIQKIRDVGGVALPNALAELIRLKEQTGRPIRAEDLVAVIRDTSLYSYVGQKEVNPTPGSYEFLRSFFDASGNLCIQCTGGSQTVQELLRAVLVDHPDWKVEIHQMTHRDPQSGTIYSGSGHQWSHLIKISTGKRAVVDGTPYRLDPRNPPDSPPVQFSADWWNWLAKSENPAKPDTHSATPVNSDLEVRGRRAKKNASPKIEPLEIVQNATTHQEKPAGKGNVGGPSFRNVVGTLFGVGAGTGAAYAAWKMRRNGRTSEKPSPDPDHHDEPPKPPETPQPTEETPPEKPKPKPAELHSEIALAQLRGDEEKEEKIREELRDRRRRNQRRQEQLAKLEHLQRILAQQADAAAVRPLNQNAKLPHQRANDLANATIQNQVPPPDLNSEVAEIQEQIKVLSDPYRRRAKSSADNFLGSDVTDPTLVLMEHLTGNTWSPRESEKVADIEHDLFPPDGPPADPPPAPRPPLLDKCPFDQY